MRVTTGTIHKLQRLNWRLARRNAYSADGLLAHFDALRPAVQVERIATALGISVHRAMDPGWAGAVQIVGEEAHIWVSGGDNLCRQRFTLAHELGHLLMHPEDQLRRAAFRDNARFSGGPQEVEANQFAADLLVPMWMLKNEIERFGMNETYLAEAFDVSTQVMKIRLMNMALR